MVPRLSSVICSPLHFAYRVAQTQLFTISGVNTPAGACTAVRTVVCEDHICESAAYAFLWPVGTTDRIW
jgi:hypothetical protein